MHFSVPGRGAAGTGASRIKSMPLGVAGLSAYTTVVSTECDVPIMPQTPLAPNGNARLQLARALALSPPPPPLPLPLSPHPLDHPDPETESCTSSLSLFSFHLSPCLAPCCVLAVCHLTPLRIGDICQLVNVGDIWICLSLIGLSLISPC